MNARESIIERLLQDGIVKDIKIFRRGGTKPHTVQVTFEAGLTIRVSKRASKCGNDEIILKWWNPDVGFTVLGRPRTPSEFVWLCNSAPRGLVMSALATEYFSE